MATCDECVLWSEPQPGDEGRCRYHTLRTCSRPLSPITSDGPVTDNGATGSRQAKRFAQDSPLEQAGFEPSVPVREKSFWELPYLSCGTPRENGALAADRAHPFA